MAGAPNATAQRSFLRRVFGAPETGLVLVILVIGAALTVLGRGTQTDFNTGQEVVFNKFLNWDNIQSIATGVSFTAVMAVGMTMVLISAGVDLSVGSIYAMAGIVGAIAMRQVAPDASLLVTLPVSLLACTATGAVCGFLNGSTIVGLRVHPFIITLGAMSVYRGLAFVTVMKYTTEVLHAPGSSIGDLAPSLQSGLFRFGFSVAGHEIQPTLTIITLATAAVGVFVLRSTVYGRQVLAIGGNETAARYAGVPVGRRYVTLYTVNGLLAGLAAWMMVGYYGAGQSSAGEGYELNVIAAAVVGGTSLSGGRGTVLGALLGAVVIELIRNAITVLGADENYTKIIIGLSIVAAVVIDQTKQRLGKR